MFDEASGTYSKFLKVNQETSNKEKMQFNRVIVEVIIDQEFPNLLSIIKEKSLEVVFDIQYD